MKTKHKYSFGSVPFVNAGPLAAFIPEVDPHATVVCHPPARLTEELLNGNLSAAIMPTVDFFQNDDLRMIDDIGIAADGDVLSVLLKCERPIEKLRAVSLDPDSSTSNALARLLLQRNYGLSVEFRYPSSDRIDDACVVIGDRALQSAPATCGDLDLAGEWKRATGLPFVFAVWAYRPGTVDSEDISRILHAARRLGAERVETLVANCAAKLDLQEEFCRKYLTSAVRYDIGPREIEGMNCFRDQLNELSTETAQP